MDVLKHWFSLMGANGWIAREQILGEEARSKVPAEFQVQNPKFANPPTMLLVIEKIHTRYELNTDPIEKAKLKSFLENIFPSLAKFYKWFKDTQFGAAPNSYRWRGRTENHTLTSGLDDYPRASPPSTKELHLDLLCWMAASSRTIAKLAASFGQDPKPFQQHYEDLQAQLDGTTINLYLLTWVK